MPRLPRTFAILLAALWAAAQSVCPPAAAEPAEPIVVGATVAPQAYFLSRLAGSSVHVETLLPPGANHETFEPSLGQMTRLRRARAFFAVGHPRLMLEQAWLPRIQSLAPGILIVDTTKTTRGDDRDDHIWLSFAGAEEIVQSSAAALEELLPGEKARIADNASQLHHEIAELRSRAAIRAAQPGTSFLAYHPSWTYLARELGIDQLVVEEEGKEVGLVSASRVIREAKRRRIKVIVAEPSSPPRQIDYLRSALDAQVMTIDPVGENWFATVQSFIDAVAPAVPGYGASAS